nr:MAG TPA: hypothetical protein [Bacteriophage sp.]
MGQDSTFSMLQRQFEFGWRYTASYLEVSFET